MRNRNRNNRTPAGHVAIRLGEWAFACDATFLQEIVRSPVLEPGIDGPELVVGFYLSSRGLIPVLDLLGRSPDGCPIHAMSMAVFCASGNPVGLLADEILSLVEIRPSSILPLPPGSCGVNQDLLSGLVSVDGVEYYLINLDMVVSSCAGAVGDPPLDAQGDVQ
jgi:chemotaxis signal transduction protein